MGCQRGVSAALIVPVSPSLKRVEVRERVSVFNESPIQAPPQRCLRRDEYSKSWHALLVGDDSFSTSRQSIVLERNEPPIRTHEQEWAHRRPVGLALTSERACARFRLPVYQVPI